MRKPRGPRPALMQLTDGQRALLEEIAAGRRRPHDEVQRAAIILQSADGARARHVAETLGLREPTIRLWRARWVQATPQLVAAEMEGDAETLGVLLQQVLHEAPRRGRPATFTAEQLGQIVAVACEVPAASGRPVTHWTPRELAEEVSTRGIVPSISPRSIRRFLKSGGLETAPVALWAQAPPRRGSRAICRRRPDHLCVVSTGAPMA